jgi:N-methylhydantoinase A
MPRADRAPRGARVAVDIGGTFTDLVWLAGGRVAATVKTPTTSDDPSRAVETGIRRLLEGRRPEEVAEIVHGTTLVSNALIERKGARSALITTAGFRDVLGIGREQRYDLYDLSLEMPEPLVRRRERWELDERVLADGTVDRALDPDEVRRIARRMRRARIESIAVCLLHSYRHPDHERRVAEVLGEELPEVPVSLSCEVAPELGEFVRASTVVANAYVRPLVDRYLHTLEGRLERIGIDAPLHIMLSTGGLAAVGAARRYPVRLSESGPAAGVLSAAFWGGRARRREVLAFDMGGTTAKACIVEGGTPLVTRESEVARVYRFAKGSGLPLRSPVIDLIEIGAGGGSIAHVGPFGLLKVGPESAAGEPGPVCYGHGGTRPTVTDADLVLGYLNPDYFLGGEMELDLEGARRAIGTLASELGLGLEEAAAGIHRVVNESMASAARMHAIERGRDLGRSTLVATGGAGPVHAWGVARGLGMRSLIFPPSAGVASAFGLLTAARSFDFVRSSPALLSEVVWRDVRRMLASMTRDGLALLAAAGVGKGEAAVSLAADVRHRGQGHSVTVELGSELPAKPAAYVEESFERAYSGLYGRRPPGVEPEVLSWRVRTAGPNPRIRTAGGSARVAGGAAQGEDGSGRGGGGSGSGSGAGARGSGSGARGARRKARRAIFSPERGGFVEARVIDRYGLEPGATVSGPAVVEERESTVVIGVGGRGIVDRSGSLVVSVDG